MNKLTWDLNRFFSGESQSTQFSIHLSQLDSLLNELERFVPIFSVKISTGDVMEVVHLVENVSTISLYLSEARSFITCLLAEDPSDVHAAVLRGEISKKEAHFEKELFQIKKGLANACEDV